MKKKVILVIACLIVVIALGLWFGNYDSSKNDNHKSELENQEIIDDSKNTNDSTNEDDHTSDSYKDSSKDSIELPIDVIEDDESQSYDKKDNKDNVTDNVEKDNGNELPVDNFTKDQ